MASRLEEDFDEAMGYITDEYCAVLEHLHEIYGSFNWERKEFAQAVMNSRYRAALFMIHDGRDCAEHVWKLIRPTRTLPFKEEAA
jgi:hypothetical protein